MLFSCEAAATRLGLSARQVRLLCKQGTLPAEKVGWSWAIKEKDLPKAAARPKPGRKPAARRTPRQSRGEGAGGESRATE